MTVSSKVQYVTKVEQPHSQRGATTQLVEHAKGFTVGGSAALGRHQLGKTYVALFRLKLGDSGGRSKKKKP